MGRVLRREHEGKRLAFAALLSTGMMALLLALAALVAPSSAYAGEMQGTGTADDPVLIHNTEELVAWCEMLNDMGKDQERQQHARLMSDLTAPGPDGTEYGGAVDNKIIGRMKHPDLQVAEFDGNGHLIELKLEGYSALFQTGGQPGVGRTGVTKIKDLHIIGSVNNGISDGGSVGTLFASIGKEGDSSEDRRIEITDCTNQANVQGSSNAGGFIGSYYDNDYGKGSIVIERCSNFGEIQSSNGHAGGLVGSLVEYTSTPSTSDYKSCLEYCSNNGAVKSMGGSFSTYDDVNNEDKPEAIGGSAGGLVGYLSYKSINVIIGNDYNQGEIYSASDIGYSGGLVGFADTALYKRTVSACYNTGAIKTDAKEAGHAGGLFGYALPRAFEIKMCQTLEGSVPADAISGSTCNGEIVRRIDIEYGNGYIDNDSDMYLDNGYQVLNGAGVGRSVKVTLINPMNSQHASDAYDNTYWNTVFSSSNADAPSGYRLAYWTREAPDANGTWSEPPKEYKADPNDIHDRIYGGEPVFYAYCEPSSATVKLDLNKPAGGYTCSLDPKDVTKTYVKGEPVGALPTATCVSNSNKNDTRAFLGWATKPDGSDPQAEWISANSDNLYHYVKSREVTLYAQWANTSLPFDIFTQPENCVASALAEVVNQRIDFGFSTTYPFDSAHRYSVQLQYREDSDEDYKEVTDLLPSNYNNRVYFTLDSVEQTKGDYRLKIDYYELDNLMGSLYTSSANIVLQIPQVKADLSYIKLSKDDIYGNNSGTDEIMGTKAYDLFGDIMGDLPLLLGDTPSPEDELEPNNYAYNVWIEGGSIVPSKQYVADKGSFRLAGQHLKEGQTYQLCVARAFHRPDVGGTYKGESEPYCIPFEVPYADTMPASITAAKMSGDDVVTPDNKPCSFESHTGIAINGDFNLVADLKYDQPQPEGAVVHAQWQYCKFGKGGWGWADVPENLIEGSPYYIAWSDDRKTARVYTTLRAYEKLDECYFRVKVSTPTSLTNAISDETSELSVYLPTPKITQEPTVTNDTQMNLAWEWRDGAGKPMDTGGFTVVIERQEPGAESWDEEKTAWTKDESYQTTLDPQRTYRVCVRAETTSLESDYTSHCEFVTAGETGLTWDDSYCTAYLSSEQKSDKISVDYDWASYNDGKHVAQYTWKLNRDKNDERGYEHFETFATTESDSVVFPDDFMNDKKWDPMEAWWVSVEARVWALDDEGNLDHIVDSIKRTPALPVIHNTTEPRNLEVKDIGSHSATVCWDAPDEGMVREYEVRAGGHTLIIPAVKGKTSYQATFNDLWADTSYSVSVSTIDSRKKDSTIATATYGEIRTLSSPEVGTWAATADKTAATIGDIVTLSALYEAGSGEFSSGAQLQWYSWREGDADWKPEGTPVTFDDDDESCTVTQPHMVSSEDYGRQWKLGVKATSPDEAVTGSSNVVTVSITPATPTGVACDTPTPTSIPVSWMPVADAEGYQIECVKQDADGNPVNATTYTVAASSLTPGADGKLCYEVSGLEPSTAYQVSIAAFVHGVTGEFSAAVKATTLAVPTIQTPEFQQVPKTAWVEAGADATFTAQAKVNDEGTITYAWQRKGAGEQNFAPLAQSDKYVMSEDAGVATLTVKHVGADDVAATFRCVATNSKDNQKANAVSPVAYLTVTPVAPTDAKAWATSATTGEVTWTANGEVRRFVVTWHQIYSNGDPGPEYSKVVTISSDTTQGSCQLDGLVPNSGYYVEIKAAPQGGFIGKNDVSGTSFSTPHASELNAATVSPDKTLVKPGEEVTFEVATNVDGVLPEKLEYRWQHNSFGETWIDVEGEAGAKKELSVTAPEGGSIDGYRCIVTSTRTTFDKYGKEVGSDTKSVTSSTGLLLTSVPVAQPTQLAAEPGTTSAHLTWASNDARDVTYQVQYAEGPTPNVDAWQTVNNVGSSTSCDVEGLKANTVYSWRVQAVVRDQLYSDWAQADTFTTLEEPSALATVVVTPRQGVAVAGSNKGVAYTAVTNIDNALNGETLSYQWQENATGEVWRDVPDATEASFVADTSDTKPRSCQYRCVVTASKDSAALKTITSDSVSFMTTAVPPTSLVANNITAATADLSWKGSLVKGLSYRVLWRVSGTDAWTSTPDLTEATYTLSSLMPATTYEWYVQVMDSGQVSARSATSLFVTQSLSPVPQLTRVVVGPVDQTPSAGEQAKLTAYTNVDDVADATMTYKWEIRNLDSDPKDSNAWRTLDDKTTREITLPAYTDGYVRCTVTYTPPVSVLAMPLDNTSVTSTNEARVRVMPTAPSDLKVTYLGKTDADISWTPNAGAQTHDLVYRMLGSSEWTIEQRLGYSNLYLDDLEPGTTYEWRVRSVAFSASGDPLCSDWVVGPLFTTNPEDIVFSQVEVTPSATSVMAGADRIVTLTAKTNADVAHEQLTYQWQRFNGSAWEAVENATAATLQVFAKDLTVGEHAYRCEVTATRVGVEPKTLTSNESVVTVKPAAPTDLFVNDIQLVDPDMPSGQVKATFHWTLGNAALPEGATFEVSYRKLAGPGAIRGGWTSKGLTVDNKNMTCQAILEATDITYQWRVRVVQNGVTSPWSAVDTFITAVDQPAEDLTSVLVAPSDSLVSNEDVILTASTNVDDDSALTYQWQWCELATVDPHSENTKWQTMEDKTSKELTLSGADRNRFVRCTVTQTVDGASKTVASNPACVRTEPIAPHDTFSILGTKGGITLGWDCDDVRANKAQKNVIGYEVNYRKVGTSEWIEKICATQYCELFASVLEPDATYEWRVRTLLSGDVGQKDLTKGGPHSDWADGPVFTSPKVEVTPARAAAVIGSGRTLTFTATPNDVITNDSRDETYQWQRYNGTKWEPVSGAESKTFSIVANDATTAGTNKYRCVVTIQDNNELNNVNVTSNEVTCTLAPAAPASLAASDITSGEATLTWGWAQGGLQEADEFKVLYRESGAKVWETATVSGGARQLVLEGLKPETIYEWRVQAVQNGVESLPSSSNLFVTASEHPALKLESVLVDPSDQAVAPGAQATVKATTNLDGMVHDGELTYVWEKRALDSDPNAPGAWQEIEGQTGNRVTSSVITSGFVRCTVTYTVNGSVVGSPVVSNQASVRVLPADAPTGLEVKDVGNTKATLAWGGTLPTNGSFTLVYRAAGTEAWTTVPKLTASSYTAQDLAPGTTYEWRMRSESADGLTSEWADGPRFTTTAQDAKL